LGRGFVRGWVRRSSLRPPLLGGDTVSAPRGAARSFGLTAIGEAEGPVPLARRAQGGDLLWVSGTIGDAGAGLRVALGELAGADRCSRATAARSRGWRLGQALAPLVSAMMDVSDGLLIDAARMARRAALGSTSSSTGAAFARASRAARRRRGRAARCRDAGDDYELLFAAPEERAGGSAMLAERSACR
jgi:thiamine-monophosphate kinase